MSGSLGLDDPVTSLDGVGPKLARDLAGEFDITTIRDLVEHYPRRHQDLGELMDLHAVVAGEPATLVGTIAAWNSFQAKSRNRLRISEATVQTDLGGTFRVTFFNQPWRQRDLPPGTVAAFSGEVKNFRGQWKFASPEVTRLGRGIQAVAGAAHLDHRQLLPVYPATAGLPTWRLTQLVEAALERLEPVPDWLPERLLDEHDLLDLDTALRAIHLPEDRPTLRAARKRLVFDELLTLQLGLQWRRARLEASLVGLDNTPRDDGLAARYLDALPFDPTGAQQRAFTEIGEDLGSERPMHRLLQGDVGAGKTVVAVWTMLTAVDAGRQAALMVPTEVLAEQHHRTLLDQLAPLGVNVLDGVRVELLTGTTSMSQRRRILGELLAGQVDILVGTHALLEDVVRFDDLGVVVIDEQHRFGVSQRVALKDKAADQPGDRASMPDVLVMTATPIPRTLTMTIYGDLDVSLLDEKPPGRGRVVTALRPGAKQTDVTRFVKDQLANGRQAYLVYPLVEESEALKAESATEGFEKWRKRLAGHQVGLMHGRLAPEEKEDVMRRFRDGEIHALVATTVIEVGVDVANATVMVLHHAERFGLAQLHQLRGRIGRGGEKSYCILLTDGKNPEAMDKLKVLENSTDGFEIAEADLRLRGPGDVLGTLQSGLADLRFTDFLADTALLREARALADRVIAEDPKLERAHRNLRALLRDMMADPMAH